MVFAAEYRVTHNNGSVHWLRVKGRMFFDAERQPERMVAFMIDITDLRHAEEEHRAYLWFLESIDRINRAIHGSAICGQVLDDDPRQPRFIETVSRRGYRYIAVPTAVPAGGAVAQVRAAPAGREAELWIIGRTEEVTRLHSLWDGVLGGKRAVVWIAGEPGIGKTILIEHFVAGVRLSAAAQERPRLSASRLSQIADALRLRFPRRCLPRVALTSGACRSSPI